MRVVSSVYILLCYFQFHKTSGFQFNGRVGSVLSQTSERCPEPSGQFPSNKGCDKYLECHGGIAHEMTCPLTLYFNPNLRYCDWPRNVNCIAKPSFVVKDPPVPSDVVQPPQEVVTSTRPPGPPRHPVITPGPVPITTPSVAAVCPKKYGLFPSTNSCSEFLNCFNGFPFMQKCPSTLYYNPKLRVCDYPRNVDCANRFNTVVDVTPSVPSKEDQPPQEVSTPTAPPTPSRNPAIISGNVPGGPIIVPGHVPTTPVAAVCPRKNGLFPSKNSCNEFVNCFNGFPFVQKCPDTLYFNPQHGGCDYPHNVDCKNRFSNDVTTGVISMTPTTVASIPTDTSGKNPVSTSPPNQVGEIKCPALFGTFRTKWNCTNYFTCIAGQVVASYNCPEGFSFNDNIGVCDYSYRVDCTKDPLIFTRNPIPNFSKDVWVKINTCTPGTVFSLNQQCTTACICKSGLSEIVECPSGLAYDFRTDKCVLPENSRCSNSS